MKNYEESVEKNHDSNWPYIPDHRHNILIIGGSGSSKTDVLPNLTSATTDYSRAIDDAYENS